MELILKQDVQNLGFKDDVVTVKTDTVVTFNSTRICSISNCFCKVLAENLKQRAHKAKVVADAQALDFKSYRN
jgi:large subunit ribosomal protein L9